MDTRVLLKLLLIHITSLIFLVVAMMRGNALVHVMYMKYERSSRNFRSFPPSSRIAIPIPPVPRRPSHFQFPPRSPFPAPELLRLLLITGDTSAMPFHCRRRQPYRRL